MGISYSFIHGFSPHFMKVAKTPIFVDTKPFKAHFQSTSTSFLNTELNYFINT